MSGMSVHVRYGRAPYIQAYISDVDVHVRYGRATGTASMSYD